VSAVSDAGGSGTVEGLAYSVKHRAKLPSTTEVVAEPALEWIPDQGSVCITPTKV
jgi:hypothetical protein